VEAAAAGVTPQQAGSIGWQITLTLPNGEHTIDVTAHDGSGNELASGTFTVTNQGTPPAAPTAAITAPTEGQKVTGLTGAFTITGTANATEGGPITQVKVRLNGGAWQVATGTDNWTLNITLAAGATTIEAQSFTAAGASNIVRRNATYTAPGPPPTVTVTTPLEGATINTVSNQLTVSGTAAPGNPGGAALDKVQVKINGGAYADATGTTNWTTTVTLGVGANTITAKSIATDTQESTEVVRHVTYNPPPTITITAPAGGANVSRNVAVQASITGNTTGVTGVNFRVNGTTVFDTAALAGTVNGRLDTLSLGLANGPASLTVETTGNVATSPAVNVTINNGRSLYVQDVSGNSGSNVAVQIKLNDYTNAAGFHVVLNFDSTKLSLVSVANGAGAPGSLVTNTATPGVVDVALAGTNAFTGNEVLVVTLTIVAVSPSGTRNEITMPTATLDDTGTNPLTVTGVGGRVVTN